jgi:hypothetical protein
MRKTINTIVGLLIGAAVGAVFMWAFTPDPPAVPVVYIKQQPAESDRVVIVPCASEDSCTVDYYDGAWHIGPDGSANNN